VHPAEIHDPCWRKPITYKKGDEAGFITRSVEGAAPYVVVAGRNGSIGAKSPTILLYIDTVLKTAPCPALERERRRPGRYSGQNTNLDQHQNQNEEEEEER
jgi:hypothetical protein